MMSEEQDYALGEMDRRMGNVMRFGTVAEVDTAKALVKVNLGELTTEWVPWTTRSAGQNRVWSVPDVGEQVVLLSPGDPSQGVVLGSVFQSAHPANGDNGKDFRVTFKDGSLVEFDRDGSVMNVQVNPAGSIRLNIGGTTLLLQDGQATLTTPLFTVDSPTTHLTGDLTVDGALSFAGGMSGAGGGTTAVFNGNVQVNGDLNATGSVTDGNGDGGA